MVNSNSGRGKNTARGSGVSIQEVARAAGVSASTVSRVLNERISGVTISEPTAERVRAVAARMNYRPNRSALSLRTSKTNTIGVIVLDVAQPFSGEFLRVINGICRTRGYFMLVGHAENRVEESRALVDILGPDQVDGILLLGDALPFALSKAEMEAFVQDHRHVVTVASRPRNGGEIAITVDNLRGVTLALEHLAALGHRHIAYVGPTQPPLTWEEQERYNAYVQFMNLNGLPWSADSTVEMRSNNLQGAREAMRLLLSAPVRPTAAFANSDIRALLMLKAASIYGLRVPEDFSLVGFDDLPLAELSSPGLTTVHQPIEDIGRYAATALIDSISTATVPPPPLDGVSGTDNVVFPPVLVCRESTCSPGH